MITQTINLNMIPGAVYPVIHVSQYDNDSGALVFNLYNGDGTVFTIPASSAVVINGTKPDGYGFSYSATYSGSVVTADVTQQMTAVAGEVKCELRITNSSDVVGTQNFTLMVEEAALDDNTVVSDSDIPAIAAAADYAAAAAASAAEASSTLSSKASKWRPEISWGLAGNTTESNNPKATLRNSGNQGSANLGVTLAYTDTSNNTTLNMLMGAEGKFLPGIARGDSVSLGSNESATFTIAGNIGLIAGIRGSDYLIALVTYWSNTVTYIAQNGTLPSITTSANNNTVTVNNSRSNAFPIIFLTGQ